MLLLGVGLFAVARWAGGPLSLEHLIVLVLVAEFVINPFSTLLHELGHALAVTRLGRRTARVVVGRGPWLEMAAGRIHLRFSLLPARGVTFGGICVYESAGLPWRTLGLIALAGPLATLFELVGLLALAPALWQLGALARGLLILTAGGLVASLLGNLSRERLVAGGDRAVVAQPDGWKARRAFALHREGAPPLPPARDTDR
jgi:hypothetical protein